MTGEQEIEVSSNAGAEGLQVEGKRAYENTCEAFKIEITNLPRKTKYYLVQQLADSFKLKPHKIRVGDGIAYLAFQSDAERNDAISKVDQQEFKGRQLSAKLSVPKVDPYIKKHCSAEAKELTDEVEEINDDSINSQVCPFWNRDYEEQLRFKESTIKTLVDISRPLMKLCPDLKKTDPKLYEWCQNKQNILFEGTVPSPVLLGYRNKCEFNVGSDGVVGFKMGRYRNGSDRVVLPPKNCPILNQHMFNIRDTFQNYLNNQDTTKLRGFNQVTHEGHVRQITIRTNQKDECLVIIDLHPQNLSKEDLDHEIASIVDLYNKSNEKVVSIYINVSERSHHIAANETMKLVFGEPHLYELLMVDPEEPLKFRIGPTSFFQVNTKAAEILYKSIINVAGLNPKSLVLDVGCGTGTIGLSLAKRVSYVIGIEIVKSAIEDAKENARENNISNVAFFAGKAEDLIGETISILRSKLKDQNNEGEIVAIVDPPRTGFNNSFIKTLRSSNINKIIYVACDPKANTNLVTLCRPTSKAYQGEPFVPTRAKAFDLFPHTKFCELVLVYERFSR